MPRARVARSRHGTSSGHSLIDEVGELVITEPMPSMPLFLWGDDDGERLRESYFAMYPGIWRHGDWIRITPRGGAVIYGRSDSTINRQGVRMGTSEIYRAARRGAGGARRARGGRPRGAAKAGELWMVLFVVLARGRRARRRAGGPDQAAHPRGLLAAPRAQRDPARSSRCRARCRARCSRCRSSDPDGHPGAARPRASSRWRSPLAGLLRGAGENAVALL